MNETTYRAAVDLLDASARFVTSAACEAQVRPGTDTWGGILTHVEPYKHLGSGRYRMRLRDGGEAWIVVQARQRVGRQERYPFVGVGRPPAFELV